jgi:O-antigen/teichoic acid export membrane protein
VAAAGALMQRTVILGFARRKRPELFQLRGQWRGDTFREMLPLAARAWLTALGSTLLLYTDQFVITSLEGAKELPAYRAAWVLVHNITVVAVTFGTASGVFVSHLWQAEDLKQVHRVVERNVRFGWFTMLAGASVLLFAGDALFSLWLGPGNFVGYPILIAFLVTETLEAQSYIISCAARATGDEAFAWSYLLAGALKLGLSIFLAHHYGLLGVALGTVIALLLTNHWYVPWRGLRSLCYSRWHLVLRTVLPAVAWFGVLTAMMWPTRHWLAASSPWLQLIVAVVIVTILFSAALTVFVLEPAQRRQVWARMGRPFRFT